MAAPYEFRPFRSGEEDAILDLFNLVFSTGNEAFRPRTRADFDWSFLENPGGTRGWVAVHGEQVVAFYGTQPNRVKLEGERRIFAQVVDSMVHPEHRRGLKRPGLFVETARRMLDANLGERPDEDMGIYGWPVPAAWRMSRTFLGAEFVRIEAILARGPGGGSTALPAGVVQASSVDAGLDPLYARCSGDWGLSTMRDAAWLDWRFVRNPRHAYEILTVPDADAIAGYAVFRASDWPIPGCGLIMDWLVPPGEDEVAEHLREALLARARAHGVGQVLALFPDWTLWFARFQEWGWTVHPSDLLMTARLALPAYDPYWLRDHWWYQFADLDLA